MVRWELHAAGTKVAELQWREAGPVPVRVHPAFRAFLDWWLARHAGTEPDAFGRHLAELEASGFRLVRTPQAPGASP